MLTGYEFKTTDQTYRRLMGNGLVYRVPMFQRDYSWTENEWSDLWQDIEALLQPKSEPIHYMGQLILKQIDVNNYEIIDGQQRLATMSILILAVMHLLQELAKKNSDTEANTQRAQQLRNTFIGHLDAATLITTSKLNLNRNNDTFYQRYLVPLENIPKRGLQTSEMLMGSAFNWFVNTIRKYLKNSTQGTDFARIIEEASDKIFFTIIITDEVNAYKVFETLNARGTRLSTTDLLKNHLFYTVYQSSKNDRELDALDKRWQILAQKLGAESLTDFLKIHWNSRHNQVNNHRLFQSLKTQITSREAVFELIKNLEDNADIYMALSKPDDTLWTIQQKKQVGLFKLFDKQQAASMLMSAYTILSDKDFTQLLKICNIITFRYNIIGEKNERRQEKIYADIALKISKGILQSVKDICKNLLMLYPDDEQFKAAFAQKQLNTSSSQNKHILRYILFQIEKHFSDKDYDINSDKYNIEHILPENPQEGWQQFNDMEHHEYVYRIGNMTLLTKKANNKAANQDFDHKKNIYEKSNFNITKKISEENAEWNTERIAVRQKWMAKQAIGIWKISQLKTM